ncbi:MAG: tRNA pseudouridine(55) synthase TruB [Acidimicrobiales bacterium]
MTDGLLVVDKPAGMTSHDVVGRLRRIFSQKSVGHAGTLDPDATGVLLIGLGRATRLLQYLSGLPKSYIGEVVLGLATTTQDASGDVVGRWPMHDVTLEVARRQARAMVGTLQQVPPMYSAVKVGGRRLHQLARAGVEVERPPRQVTVTRFDLDWADDQDPGDPRAPTARTTGTPAPLTTDEPGPTTGGDPAPTTSEEPGLIGKGGPVLAIGVDCSSGTYLRTLAADLGTALGGGAHLRKLRRTRVGPWSEDLAAPLDENLNSYVLPPAAAVPFLHRLAVGEELAAQVAHGRVLQLSQLGAEGEGPWAIQSLSGELLAIYVPYASGSAKPSVVVVSPGR